MLAVLFITIALAIVMDIFIHYNIVAPIFDDKETYMYTVFTVLCTVATLGSAFLSIVINVLTNEYYGIHLKDILRFKRIGLQISYIVTFSLFIIIASTIFLMLNYVNTITVIAFSITGYIIWNSFWIWEIITNEYLLKDAIWEHVKFIKDNPEQTNEREVYVWFSKWIVGLKQAIKLGDDALQNEYISLIKTVLDGYKNKNILFFNEYKKTVNNIFPLALDNISFIDAYRKILYLNSDKNYLPDYRGIIIDTIERISFQNLEQIKDVKSKFKSILEINDSLIDKNEEDIKILALYTYFKSILNNYIILEYNKYNILNDFIHELCKLRFKLDHQNIRSIVIDLILKNHILLDKDSRARERLYGLLLKNLFTMNEYSEDKNYLATIAKLFRALYFYINKELELNEKHREELKRLFTYTPSLIENSEFNLIELIKQKQELIIEALVFYDIKNGNKFDYYDFFSDIVTMKDNVWGLEKKFIFNFHLYIACGWVGNRFPFENILQTNKIQLDEKIFLLEELIRQYDYETYQLNEASRSEIKNLQNLVGGYKIPDNELKEHFEYLNNKLYELNNRKYQNIQNKINDINVFEITQTILNNMPQYDYTLLLNDDSFIKEPEYITLTAYGEETIEYQIEAVIKQIISEQLRKILPVIVQNNNLDGIGELVKHLENRKYNYCNTVAGNWAFKKDIPETKEFNQLTKLMEKMKFDSSKLMDYSLFLTHEFKFNFKIIDYIVEDLNSEQLESYIKKYYTSEDRYKVDEMVLEKEKVKEWVLKTVKIQYFTFKFKTNLKGDSGFRVKLNFE